MMVRDNLTGAKIVEAGMSIGNAPQEITKSYLDNKAKQEVAKQQARAQIEVAKSQARSAVATTSIDESSEILTINDRPFFRRRIDRANGYDQYDVSLHTVYGLVAMLKAVELDRKWVPGFKNPLHDLMDNMIDTIGYAPNANPLIMDQETYRDTLKSKEFDEAVKEFGMAVKAPGLWWLKKMSGDD